MSFTYSGDPSRSMLDALRFALRDVDQNNYHFEDDELIAVLSANAVPATSPGNPQDLTLRRCALQAQAARDSTLAEQPSFKLGEWSEDPTQALRLKWDMYRYERRLVASGGWWAGGISVSAKQTVTENPDNPPHSFAVGLMDFPGTQQNVFGIGGRLFPAPPSPEPG